jgi:glutathione synthase
MNTSASFLFIMDRYETLNLETETSLLLMQELLNRDQRVFWLQVEDIALQHDQPMGGVFQVTATNPLQRTEPEWVNLNRFDAVLVRKDPPFDSEYLQLTLILDHLGSHVVQFNDVKALRDFNEKMLPLLWPEFTPPTLVTMNADQIAEFAIKHQSVVLKPLNDCSGRGISKIDVDTRGDFIKQIHAAILDSYGSPRFLVAQKYLPAVSKGDKRVFLVDGKPLGIVNRIPNDGSYLANIHQGAKCEAAKLSGREYRIITTIAPFLREQGIFLAGADFIDGYLTELNITSPSAIRQINDVSGEQVQRRIVDAMLNRIGTRKPRHLRMVPRTACC